MSPTTGPILATTISLWSVSSSTSRIRDLRSASRSPTTIDLLLCRRYQPARWRSSIRLSLRTTSPRILWPPLAGSSWTLLALRSTRCLTPAHVKPRERLPPAGVTSWAQPLTPDTHEFYYDSNGYG